LHTIRRFISDAAAREPGDETDAGTLDLSREPFHSLAPDHHVEFSDEVVSLKVDVFGYIGTLLQSEKLTLGD